MSATLPATPADRLAAIIAWLASCVAEQGNLRRLSAPLLIAIWKRLRGISARFLAVAATPLPPPRPATPNPAPTPPDRRAARHATPRCCPAARAGCSA